MIGKHIILQGIVEEVKAARFYAVMADEVTSHNVEHLAICCRFVDDKADIREELLCFLKFDRITGERIAQDILEFLRNQDNSDQLYSRTSL